MLILLSGVSNGQQKKSKKVPPPIVLKPIEKESVPEYPGTNDSKKCFVYKTEETKGAMIYVKENLLEYGWAGTNARMIVTTYQYDPAIKQKNENSYIYSKSLKFIEGDFKIENGKLNFTPDKTDLYQKQTFKLINKSKSKIIDHIEDEDQHQYKKGECLQPTVSI